jgi:ATP-binding protein involved in chromosome partitioning
MKVHFLGELPLNPAVRVGGDTGRPVALGDGNNPEAAAFQELARNMVARAGEAAQQTGPKIEISD